MLDHRETLRVRVVVVAFAEPDALRRYQDGLGLGGVLVLADPQRSAYSAFGFGRGSVARVWLHPGVWQRYATLLARGRRPTRARQDTLQLGGDVLAGADGRIRWIYRSAGPEDRPSLATVRAALAASSAAGGADGSPR